MKIWMIVAVLGVLAIAGFAVVNALGIEDVSEEVVDVATTCGGGCGLEGSCSNPSCGFIEAGSCGCGRS